MALLIPGEADKTDHLFGARLSFRFRPVPDAKLDVFQDAQMREQRVILKDKAYASLLRRHMRSIAANDAVAVTDASRILLFKARENPQRRCLTTATRPQQGEDLALVHFEVQPRDNRRSRAETLMQVFNGEEGHTSGLVYRTFAYVYVHLHGLVMTQPARTMFIRAG